MKRCTSFCRVVYLSNFSTHCIVYLFMILFYYFLSNFSIFFIFQFFFLGINTTNHNMDKILVMVCSLTSILSTLIFNGIVMLTFIKMKHKKKKKTSNILLLNQSFADAVLIIPTFMHVLLQTRFNSWKIAISYKLSFSYTSFISISSIMLTTLDRFMALKYPVFHKVHVTKTKVSFAIVVVWAVCVVPALVENSFRYNLNYMVFPMIMFSILFSFVSIILFLLFSTFKSIRQSNTARSVFMRSGTDSTPTRDNKMVKILFAMALSYSVTIVPYIAVNFLDLQDNELIEEYELDISYIVYTLSGCIDPLLTIYIKNDFTETKCFKLPKIHCYSMDQKDLEDETLPVSI